MNQFVVELNLFKVEIALIKVETELFENKHVEILLFEIDGYVLDKVEIENSHKKWQTFKTAATQGTSSSKRTTWRRRHSSYTHVRTEDREFKHSRLVNWQLLAQQIKDANITDQLLGNNVIWFAKV